MIAIRYFGGIKATFTKYHNMNKAMILPATITMEIRKRYSSNTPKLGYKINSLTKSLTLLSASGTKYNLENSKEIVEVGKAKSLKLSTNPETNPMVVMLPWLMSQPKHYHKYAELYLQLGFDVLTARLSPTQLMFPVNGSQIVAKDLLTFLEVNNKSSPLLIHGFSVGGYLWGELLTHVEKDRERYSNVMNRITGQIWDSFADVRDIPTGFSFALFPKNTVLRQTFQSYLKYHMKTFYEAATQHYERSSQNFNNNRNMVNSPALILVSRTDHVGTLYTNTRLKECWDALGITTSMKVWDDSPHVMHYIYHPEEYVAEIATFLSKIKLVPIANKMQALN